MSIDSANLDLLRSLAVILVFCSHALPLVGVPWQKSGLDQLGFLGVALFFIHTSLVLMMSLDRLRLSGGPLAARFYVRRAFRVYPLAILTVLAAVVFKIPPGAGGAWHAHSTSEVWSNILLIQNVTRKMPVIGPLWSLPYEVQMYLLLPLVFFAGGRMRPAWLLLSGLVINIADSKLSRIFGYPALLGYAPWFFIGAWVFFRRPRVQLPAWLFPCALGIFVAGNQVIFHFIHAASPAAWLQRAWGILFGAVLPMFADIQNRGARKVFHTIAKYSYGVYLVHMPVLWFCFDLMQNGPAAVRMSFAVTLTVQLSVVLFNLVEAPFIALGKRVSNALEPDRRLAMAVEA